MLRVFAGRGIGLRLVEKFGDGCKQLVGDGPASAGSEQGTKRKRDGPSDDDDDESGAHEEGGEDAAPLC